MGKRKESGTEEEVIIGIRGLNYIDSISCSCEVKGCLVVRVI